jgi:hypothetical protein
MHFQILFLLFFAPKRIFGSFIHRGSIPFGYCQDLHHILIQPPWGERGLPLEYPQPYAICLNNSMQTKVSPAHIQPLYEIIGNSLEILKIQITKSTFFLNMFGINKINHMQLVGIGPMMPRSL